MTKRWVWFVVVVGLTVSGESLVGSWTTRTLLYCTPETDNTIFGYFARAHPELL